MALLLALTFRVDAFILTLLNNFGRTFLDMLTIVPPRATQHLHRAPLTRLLPTRA